MNKGNRWNNAISRFSRIPNVNKKHTKIYLYTGRKRSIREYKKQNFMRKEEYLKKLYMYHIVTDCFYILNIIIMWGGDEILWIIKQNDTGIGASNEYEKWLNAVAAKLWLSATLESNVQYEKCRNIANLFCWTIVDRIVNWCRYRTGDWNEWSITWWKDWYFVMWRQHEDTVVNEKWEVFIKAPYDKKIISCKHLWDWEFNPT